MVNKIKDNIGLVFVAIAAIAILCTFLEYDKGQIHFVLNFKETGVALAEVLIAAVIYYEIEENRIAHFLDDSTGKHYEDRAEVYKNYALIAGTGWKERSASFSDAIWKKPELRKLVDGQITHFSHAHWLVRRSLLHRNMLRTWFPQVIVRMWAMLSAYASDTPRRGLWAAGEIARELPGCVDELVTSGRFLPLTIHSPDGKLLLALGKRELQELKDDANAYLAQKPPT